MALGKLYRSGTGVSVDWSRATALFRLAAERGHPEGMALLGASYLGDLTMPRDTKQAESWLLKAAQAGDKNGMGALASLYEHKGPIFEISGASDFPLDPMKALYWQERASVAGDIWASFRMAQRCISGDGVPRDVTKSFEVYLRRGAEAGDPQCIRGMFQAFSCV